MKELFIAHRKNLTAWANGDDLVLAVAAQNDNTIVVVHSVGPLIVEPWIDHPNVTAVCFFILPLSTCCRALFCVVRSSGQAFLVKNQEIHLLMYCMVIGIPLADCHTPSPRGWGIILPGSPLAEDHSTWLASHTVRGYLLIIGTSTL